MIANKNELNTRLTKRNPRDAAWHFGLTDNINDAREAETLLNSVVGIQLTVMLGQVTLHARIKGTEGEMSTAKYTLDDLGYWQKDNS